MNPFELFNRIVKTILGKYHSLKNTPHERGFESPHPLTLVEQCEI